MWLFEISKSWCVWIHLQYAETLRQQFCWEVLFELGNIPLKPRPSCRRAHSRKTLIEQLLLLLFPLYVCLVDRKWWFSRALKLVLNLLQGSSLNTTSISKVVPVSRDFVSEILREPSKASIADRMAQSNCQDLAESSLPVSNPELELCRREEGSIKADAHSTFGVDYEHASAPAVLRKVLVCYELQPQESHLREDKVPNFCSPHHAHIIEYIIRLTPISIHADKLLLTPPSSKNKMAAQVIYG